MTGLEKLQQRVDELKKEPVESLLDYFSPHWKDPALGTFTYISPITGGMTTGEYNYIERFDGNAQDGKFFKVDRNDYVVSTIGIKYKLSEVKIEPYENTN